jgi:hypothetical protein
VGGGLTVRVELRPIAVSWTTAASFAAASFAAASFAAASFAAALLVVAWTGPAMACDPPYIVDEETGEFDQAAWDAGVEECARWVEEMEGSPSAADLAAQILTGLVAMGLAVWWRPKRRELEGSASWWAMRYRRLPRSWWVFVALGSWLVFVAVARAL